MTQRKLDKLLKELYSEKNKQMLEDMGLTPLDDMMKRVESAYGEQLLEMKRERIKRLERKRQFRQQMLRSAAIACTILIVSAIFSGFFDNNPVRAWQMNLKTTLVVLNDGIKSVFTPDIDENPPSENIATPKPGIISSGDFESITPEQAKNELPFKIPLPEYIPDGFEFKSGEWQSLGNINNISFTYMTEDDSPFAFVYEIQSGYYDVKQTISAPNPDSTVKEIQVGSRSVIIVTIKDIVSSAYWSDNQLMFNLSGNIDEELIIEIIEGLR